MNSSTAAESCGNGSTFYTKFREAEATEDKGVVTYDIKYVDNDGYQHWIDGFVCTA